MLRNASSLGEHAIVLGGGIAGLLAARILTEFFERVTLVERDCYPADPVFRPGVPQSHHVHILLLRGQQILEELFPGIRQDLIAGGAVDGDFLNDYRIRGPSGWLYRLPSDLRVCLSTRLLLEWQVRLALVKHAQIEIIDGHEVVNLVGDEGAKTITGVSLRARPQSGLTEQAQTELVADLVVDATGRDSNAPRWLKSLGYAPPAETILNPFLGYATRLYAIPTDPARDWQGLIIQPNPPRNLRSGVLFPTENGCWMVSLNGAGKDYAPTDEKAFLEFARGLSDPALFEAIKDAQPLSSIHGYRRTENCIRHFERLHRQPERFLVTGDAACSLNPIYGQGMAKAALDAMTLRECLSQCRDRDLSGLPHRFQRKLARVNASPWALATASDIRVPGVEGGSIHWLNKWQYAYLDRFLQLLPMDSSLTSTFARVMHMVEKPAKLFSPSVAIKVLLKPRRL